MDASTVAARPFGPTGFVSRSWRAHPSQPKPVHAELYRWLSPLRLTADTNRDVVLAVHEVVRNAIEHAYVPTTIYDPVEVTLRTEADALCLAVTDHGTWRPPATGSSRRGRGITLMPHLIASVAIHDDPRGTRVLLRHPLPDQAPARYGAHDRAYSLRPIGGDDYTGTSDIAPARGAGASVRAQR
jgi:serine/threonine-protein kinase RsbW